MIRQGPSRRFRNKDTYYSQERRSDMTLNLSEMKDEPLGKHPIQAAVCTPAVCERPSGTLRRDDAQDVVAADRVSTSTFDVDSLNDEALDTPPLSLAICVMCAGGCTPPSSPLRKLCLVDTQGGGA